MPEITENESATAETEESTDTDARDTETLDALLAELDADDRGPEALRRALDLDPAITAEQVDRLVTELSALRRDVKDLQTTADDLQGHLENDIEPRLEMYSSRLQGLRERVLAISSEVNSVQTELEVVGDADGDGSVGATTTGTGGETVADVESDVAAIANDLAELEQRVAAAFDAVTTDMESDLEQLQTSLQDDIESIDRRLDRIESAARIDSDSERNGDGAV